MAAAHYDDIVTILKLHPTRPINSGRQAAARLKFSVFYAPPGDLANVPHDKGCIERAVTRQVGVLHYY